MGIFYYISEIEEGATAIGGHHDRPDPAHPDEILDIRSQLREMTLPDGLIETTDAFYKKHHKKVFNIVVKFEIFSLTELIFCLLKALSKIIIILYLSCRGSLVSLILASMTVFLYDYP